MTMQEENSLQNPAELALYKESGLTDKIHIRYYKIMPVKHKPRDPDTNTIKSFGMIKT